MFKKISSELMTVLISVTVLVVLITSIVFTLLFSDYAISEKESTLRTMAENISTLVAMDEASTSSYQQKSISDYNLFAKEVLSSRVWIINSDGVVDRLHNSADTPYNAKELPSEYYACYTRSLSGEDFVTSDFSGYFGEKTISIFVPIKSLSNEGEFCGVVAVHCPMSSITATYTSTLMFLIVAIIVAAIIAVIISSILARFVSRPLIEMRNLAQKMAEGDYTVRASDNGKDEIGDLARSFNYLSETLESTVGELEVEKNKLNDLIQNMSEGLASFTPDGKMTRYNAVWMSLCPGNIMENEDFADALRDVFETGKSCTVAIDLADVIKFIMSPILNERHDRIDAVVVIASDITKEVRLEKTRREFVSNVSHEFRTPLTIIKGNAELLLDGAVTDPEMLTQVYERIESETEALEKLVKDLLDVSRMKAGKIKLDCTAVDLSAMALDITAKMRVITDKKKIDLVCRESKDLPPVWGDVDRLRQLIIIFIDNAVKFTPEGGTITVSTSQVDNCACLSVKDTGKGIPKEDIPFIFERFYKVDKARGGSSQGTGLGLSIASNIVELHGGGITVESDVGKGTTFNIMLPFADGKKKEDKENKDGK